MVQGAKLRRRRIAPIANCSVSAPKGTEGVDHNCKYKQMVNEHDYKRLDLLSFGPYGEIVPSVCVLNRGRVPVLPSEIGIYVRLHIGCMPLKYPL